MTRRFRWTVILLVLLLVVAGTLCAGGYVALKTYRGRGALLRGEQAYSQGNWLEAKQNYTWYLARHPGDPEVLRKYIDACLKLLNDRAGNLRDAGRAYLQLALAVRSDRALVQELIDFYRRHGLWRELDYAANIFLREDPGNKVLAFNKALAMDRLGRTAPAIEAYQRLTEAGPDETQVPGNLALLLQQQGLAEQGWQILEKALAEQPQDPGIRVERARFLLATKELTRAAEEIDAALGAGVETGEALLAAASVRTAQKDWQKALAFAQKLVSKQPETPEGYFLVVNSYLADRQVEQAIAFLSGLDPFILADNPQLYLLLAELQIDSDLLTDADQTIEAYRTAYPRDQYVFEYLAARKLLRGGNAGGAVSKLEVVVQQIPELRVARYFLALAYLEAGQRDRARSTLEVYMKSNPEDDRARAVWDATFAERSAQDVENAAAALLESEAPPFGSLVSAAYSLARQGSGGDEAGGRLALAKRLLERAIERSPSAPEGYRGLASLCLDQGDLEGARQVLARAQAAGIAASELNLLQTGLALAENKLDEAKAHFNEERALGTMPAQRAIKWAELFAERGQLDAGLELLESLRGPGTTEEYAQELDLGQMTLCTRSGDIEKTLAKIDSLTAKYASVPEMSPRLNDTRMAIARLLLAPGDRQDKPGAEKLIADVERIDPDRTDTKVLRARMFLEETPPNIDGADKLCAAALKSGASDTDLFLISGEIASRKGKFAGALDYALKASAAAPDDLNTLMALARAQLQTERFADAVTTLEKVRVSQPGNRVVLDLLGRAYAGASRFQEATAIIQQLETADGGQSAMPLRAWVLIARGEWSGAEQILRQMHEANPDDLWTIHYLARAMASQGQSDRAESFLNECVARRPELPELWTELGSSRLAERSPEALSKASFAFTQANIHQAGYLPALRGLLEVQVRMGNLGGALGLCNRFLAENPDDPDMLERKASLLAQVPGSQQEALDTVQRAIDITQRPEFFYLRGYLRVGLGDFANAIEDFRRVSQAGGGAPGNMDGLMAEAYLGLKNMELARIYCDSAREKSLRGEPVDLVRLERITARLAEENKT